MEELNVMLCNHHDAAIREALESILGGLLSEWSWTKASLPSSWGEINLWSAPPSMPQLLSWHLSIAVGHWLRAWLDMHWTHPPIPALLWLPSLPLYPDSIGGVLRTLTCLIKALTICCHRRGSTPASPLNSTLHTCPCPGLLVCPTSRWWLAQWHSICHIGSAPLRPGVLVLPALLAGSTLSQLLLLLSFATLCPPGWALQKLEVVMKNVLNTNSLCRMYSEWMSDYPPTSKWTPSSATFDMLSLPL